MGREWGSCNMCNQPYAHAHAHDLVTHITHDTHNHCSILNLLYVNVMIVVCIFFFSHRTYDNNEYNIVCAFCFSVSCLPFDSYKIVANSSS